MSLLTFFRESRQNLQNEAIRQLVNQHPRFSRYGTMTQLHIDSNAKTIRLELQLAGDPAPLKVTIESYELSERGGMTCLNLGRVQTDRAWINLALEEFLPPEKRRFEVPRAVRMVL